jgi:NTP pyrophosphatase (non-canonical NTP hydrolase)
MEDKRTLPTGNMTFGDYAAFADRTAVYPSRGSNMTYPTLGLCGESGEVAEKIKKLIRDKGGELSAEARMEIAKELGDVLWYVNAICFEIGVNLSDVAIGNLQKLARRKEAGTLGGSGDNR